ncbi:MAG: helix-turn-helix transcriptional regulator [Proteobacteria bacterium]|nr:helix-turn-helix transcriptional regulator [Pseudomonadota bacterium]
MNGTSRNRLLRELRDKEYRDAYVEGHVRAGLAFQIRALRESRNWSQEEVGRRAGNKLQSVIARLENPDYGKFSLSTLLELASAFDVGLLVRFVPFSELLNKVSNLSLEKLAAPSFDADTFYERGRDVAMPGTISIATASTAPPPQHVLSLTLTDVAPLGRPISVFIEATRPARSAQTPEMGRTFHS